MSTRRSVCNARYRYSNRNNHPIQSKSCAKTAKKFQHYKVAHEYTDHAKDKEESSDVQVNKNCHKASFPRKLHELLNFAESAGLDHIVSWQSHGRCFKIHRKKDFVTLILPLFFRQKQLTSFQRQLNLYGFNRLTQGNDSGGYYHEYFLKGRPQLSKRMFRTSVKGTYCKGADNPADEPNLYQMPSVVKNAVVSPAQKQQEQVILKPTTSSPSSTTQSAIVSQQFIQSVYSLSDILLLQNFAKPMCTGFKEEHLHHQVDGMHVTTETLLSSDPLDKHDGDDDDDDDDDDSIAEYESLWWMEADHDHDHHMNEPMIDNGEHSEYDMTSKSKLVFTLDCLLFDH